jgi:Ser/Thr protein kinase RdoA (MazF antagonist)
MNKEVIVEVQAHGMGTELVRPDWAPITLKEANKVLAFYPQLQQVSELVWHSPRPFSSATIAQTSEGKLFIKRHHHSVRSAEALMEEHRLMNHLRSRGISVSEIIVGIDEKTAFQLDEWTYEVHELASGTDLYRDAVSWSPFHSDSHAFAAGKALADMHLAAEDYHAPPRPAHKLVSSFSIFASQHPETEMAAYIAQRESLASYLSSRSWKDDFEAVLMPFYARLAPWLPDLQPLWTHNDWHASNLLWQKESEDGAEVVRTIMDFGLADQTNAVYDLATAIERNAIEWLAIEEHEEKNTVHYSHIEALLTGYESVRPLKNNESAALVAMLPLVHVEFALSEVDYFTGIVHSLSNADIAYDTFLLGHARWFNTEEGRTLLSFLEAYFLPRKG